MYKTAFKRLPDRLRKTPTDKLYKIIYSGYNDLDKAFKDIKDSRDIDKAFGHTLDLIGNNVGQAREGLADEEYRLMIKTRIIANLSNGDILTVNRVASVLLGKHFSGLDESWLLQGIQKEPAGLVIEFKNTFNFNGIKAIEKTIAGGVRLKPSVFLTPEDDIKDQEGRGVGKIFGATACILSEMITSFPYAIKDIEDDLTIFMGASLGSMTEIIEI